jgi:hypothetical protein
MSQYQMMYSEMSRPMQLVPHFVGRQRPQVCTIDTAIFNKTQSQSLSYQSQ